VPLLCDNTRTIKITKNHIQHSRTKHIEIHHHFIRDHVSNGDCELQFIETERQLADIFTKPLTKDRFFFLRNELGILDSQIMFLSLLLLYLWRQIEGKWCGFWCCICCYNSGLLCCCYCSDLSLICTSIHHCFNTGFHTLFYGFLTEKIMQKIGFWVLLKLGLSCYYVCLVSA